MDIICLLKAIGMVLGTMAAFSLVIWGTVKGIEYSIDSGKVWVRVVIICAWMIPIVCGYVLLAYRNLCGV